MQELLNGLNGKVVAIVGPTGTGKSDLAIKIAQKHDGEVINSDSMQFYRGMNIGTAKLSKTQMQGIAHHLIDILDVTEEFSVQEFQQKARETIADIQQRGKLAILVGGSGLYTRAALDELNFPATDPTVRKKYEQRIQQEGNGALFRELAAKDPRSAQKIKLNDSRRIVRALEVYELEGKPFSAFMPERKYAVPAVQIGLEMDREQLREHLAQRVKKMWDAGFLDEVKALDQHGVRQGKTASRAIGYAQALAYLDGTISLEEAQERMITLTRQFAKRQFTWFKQDPRVHWFDAAQFKHKEVQ
ncbi:MAG: tRNA (adenosine(37)-N6)-dimethylallyltransferase MiaA [Micrococcaceae bacterium]